MTRTARAFLLGCLVALPWFAIALLLMPWSFAGNTQNSPGHVIVNHAGSTQNSPGHVR